MFTVTCFDSKESSSGYVRTIYVYKVTVRILGSLLTILLIDTLRAVYRLAYQFCILQLSIVLPLDNIYVTIL